ncbi:MAG: TonB-dependent receptor, partial [Acidobacteria bacterium]|nr:TonB-dependent receptor [Acidobacteriota bacterium]
MRKLYTTKSFCVFAVCTTLAFSIFLPTPAIAQVAGASLSGTVNDTSGGPIPNAEVSIENLATGVTRATTTDKVGYYTAPNLLPGPYEVSISAPGFATQIQRGITLTVGGQQVLNFTMRVGTVSEKVEVTAELPTVQLTSSDISAVVDSRTIRELPLNGRSWTDLAILQPGVSRVETAFRAAAGTDRGERGFGTQLSISGGKPVQNNYRLDGISVNDYANGGPGNVLGAALGVDSIQEFSVITSNYSSEYGRTSGGVINAITRSGTNDFHGSAFEFLRNSALDARNFFDVDPTTGQPQRSPFRRNQFGGSAGGPIQKDSTFIFGNYEGLRQAKGVAQAVPVPSNAARNGTLYTVPQSSCAGVFSPPTGACQVTVDPAAAKYLAFWPQAPASAQPACPGSSCSDVAQFGFAGQQVLNEDFFTTRVDHRFSTHDSLFGTFFYDTNGYSGSDPLNQVLSGHHIDRKAFIVEETHLFTPTLVNSLRFGYNNVNASDNKGISAVNPQAADKSFASTPGQNAARVSVAGIQNFNGGVGSIDFFKNDYKSFQVYDDAFLTRGVHSVKFGVAVERLHNGITAFGNPAGNWIFGSLQNFLTNVPDNFSSALSSATARNVRQTIFGLYVQDDWRFRSNLTLNIGLRYEMATVPSEENGKFSSLHQLTDAKPFCGTSDSFCAGVAPLFSNATLRNFEPRIGLSWDPFRDGKTAIRAGFGMFDVLPLPYMFAFLQYRPSPFYNLGAVSN